MPIGVAAVNPESADVQAALRAIVTDHTREAGVRNLERALGKVLRKVATSLSAGDVEAPVAIGPDDIRTYLGRPRFFFEAADRTSVPGVATGLAVTGTFGRSVLGTPLRYGHRGRSGLCAG